MIGDDAGIGPNKIAEDGVMERWNFGRKRAEETRYGGDLGRSDERVRKVFCHFKEKDLTGDGNLNRRLRRKRRRGQRGKRSTQRTPSTQRGR